MKRHRFDVVSFVFGIMFLGLGFTGIYGDEDITFLEARWVWPAMLVIAGLSIVAFTVGRTPADGSVEDGSYQPVD